MTIDVDAITESSQDSQNVMTFSHTCSADADVIYMGCYLDTGVSIAASTVKYNGVSATAIHNLSAGRNLIVFRLANPASGANDVEIDLAGGSSPNSICFAMSLENVDISGSIEQATGNATATSTAISSTVNSDTDEEVFNFASNNKGGEANPTTSDTSLLSTAGTGNATGWVGISRADGESPDIDMDWTAAASQTWRSVSISLLTDAAPAAGIEIFRRRIEGY